MAEEIIHLTIEIMGIVQGVGFRPFIHNLAQRLSISGSVNNNSTGVIIEAEGTKKNLDLFLKKIPVNAPPLAIIEHIEWQQKKAKGLKGFYIVKSEKVDTVKTLISPDIATCDKCLEELFDPNDRRYLYPFINCTNCGPRYTIIKKLPYDRSKTSMEKFTMCPACENEYTNPGDRRFHAQPIGCWSCGPHIELVDNEGKLISTHSPIVKAITLLEEGKIVAVKGLGGFHLAADARNESVVRVLRKRKRRDEKPFAIMARDVETIQNIAYLSKDEKLLLVSPQRPIVLLEKKSGNKLAPSVSPKNRYFGIMLPYTPVHHLLFYNSSYNVLVMTSGNFSEEPIITKNNLAINILSPIADAFLINNRDIVVRNDDSICFSFKKKIYFIRRSRGYAPLPIKVSHDLPCVLAVGAELKNTIALSKRNHIFLSQYIGDLENSEVLNSFIDTIDHLKNVFEISPEIIAYDLHPEYLSTKYALRQKGKIKKIPIQHHHAHIASCMVDNAENGTVIGLSMDGTGYGTDGNIWGGEVLLCDYNDFKRVYHFEYIKLPGGEKAIRQPWRMAISVLYHTFGDKFQDISLPFLKELEKNTLDLIIQMIKLGLNCPLTSSCGRLFDSVASLCGIRQNVNYEGQAAMELEMSLEEGSCDGYPFEIEEDKIVIKPMIKTLVADILQGVSSSLISYRFHQGLKSILIEACKRINSETGINKVALSGGVFQNRWLLKHLYAELSDCGFQVLTHHKVPCNDGGIALGQIMIAAKNISSKKRSEKCV